MHDVIMTPCLSCVAPLGGHDAMQHAPRRVLKRSHPETEASSDDDEETLLECVNAAVEGDVSNSDEEDDADK